MKVISNGREVESEVLQAADRLIKLKKEKPFWEVVEGVVSVWHKQNPKKWKSYLLSVKEFGKIQKNKYGSSKDKETGGILRFTVDVPEPIVQMLRMLYTPEELNMDKAFWRGFARRFPVFQVAGKI